MSSVFAVCCLSWSVINCPRPDQGQTTPAASMSTHDGTATQQAGAKAVAPPAAARRTFVQVLQDPRGRCACDDCALVAFPIPWHTCTYVRTRVRTRLRNHGTRVLEYGTVSVAVLQPSLSLSRRTCLSTPAGTHACPVSSYGGFLSAYTMGARAYRCGGRLRLLTGQVHEPAWRVR